MPLIARGNGVDNVITTHGAKVPGSGIGMGCSLHTTQKTEACSPNVFINEVGVVRLNDAMITHKAPNCFPHTPLLNGGSSTVFVNGLGVGRHGDSYDEPGHTLDVVSQGTVYAT